MDGLMPCLEGRITVREKKTMKGWWFYQTKCLCDNCKTRKTNKMKKPLSDGSTCIN